MTKDTLFVLDDRLASSCIKLEDWELSQVLLKNNSDYLWFILVPRVENIQEIYQLPTTLQHLLMDEISTLSSLIQGLFAPKKINVASLGNIVSQLHVHVVARYEGDKLWPHGIWQEFLSNIPYDPKVLSELVKSLTEKLN